MNALNQALLRKDPEAALRGLKTRPGRTATPPPERPAEVAAATEWSPAVDISEDAREYLIKAELPEVKKEDVHVTAEVGTLTIMGERRFAPEQKGRKYHLVERAYGNFGRSFALPADASPGKVSAEFKDGVLTVHLVKTAKPRHQQIAVKIS